MTTQTEALKLARTALGVQLDALLGKAGHLHNDDRRRYAENGIKAIKEALAQPEQPKVRTGDCLLVGVCAPEGHKIAPQRTWVGLTNEERKDLCRSWSSPMDAIYATEAKLKEKNT